MRVCAVVQRTSTANSGTNMNNKASTSALLKKQRFFFLKLENAFEGDISLRTILIKETNREIKVCNEINV